MRHCMKVCQPKDPAFFKAMAVFAIGCGRTMAITNRNADTAGKALGGNTEKYAVHKLELIEVLKKLGIVQEPFLAETTTLANERERLPTVKG